MKTRVNLFILLSILLSSFFVFVSSCAHKNQPINQTLSFEQDNPSLCYKINSDIVFIFTTSENINAINEKDFYVTSSYAYINEDISIQKAKTYENKFVGYIYISHTHQQAFDSVFYDCFLHLGTLSTHFFLVKEPTIEINKTSGKDKLDKNDSATYKFVTNFEWNWPVFWRWDTSLPSCYQFIPNYDNKTITISNYNADNYNFENYFSTLTCEYGPASTNEGISFINTNGEKVVPLEYFSYSSDQKNIINFNSQNSTLNEYDTIVIPTIPFGILDCVTAGNGIFNATHTKQIKTVVFDSHCVCEYIGSYSFSTNTTLETLVLSDSIKKIGTGAFDGCTSLKYIHFLSNTPPPTIENNAFGSTAVTGRIVYVPQGCKLAFNNSNFLTSLRITENDIQEE